MARNLQDKLATLAPERRTRIEAEAQRQADGLSDLEAVERDNAAVDRFATRMKVKMAAARAKGRSGWHDPAICSEAFLARLLVGHLPKGNAGNLVDIAVIAMMLEERGADPRILCEALDRGDLAQPWQPIEEAVKGGPAIWARIRPDISSIEGRPDLERWEGVQMPLIHPGLYEAPGGRICDPGWEIAMPVGIGGFPDRFIAGWVPLRGPAQDLPLSQRPKGDVHSRNLEKDGADEILPS